MREYVIAVDLMGGDTPPADVFEAALCSVKKSPHVRLHFLTAAAFQPTVPTPHTMTVCSDYILSSDHPLKSIRLKKGATLCIGVDLLHDKKADALITLGNTGALLAKVVTTLDCTDDADRPALVTEIPVGSKMVAVLDVGASTQARASQLVQFAFLGARYMQRKREHTLGRRPKIALLNIGTESEKGTDEIKLAYATLLKYPEPPFEFVGNIEPNAFFFTDVDVVVTSGFAGNIFLKSLEGCASYILSIVEKLDSQDKSIVSQLQEALYSKASFGSTVVGIDGHIIKCHGSASKDMIMQAMQSCLNSFL